MIATGSTTVQGGPPLIGAAAGNVAANARIASGLGDGASYADCAATLIATQDPAFVTRTGPAAPGMALPPSTPMLSFPAQHLVSLPEQGAATATLYATHPAAVTGTGATTPGAVQPPSTPMLSFPAQHLGSLPEQGAATATLYATHPAAVTGTGATTPGAVQPPSTPMLSFPAQHLGSLPEQGAATATLNPAQDTAVVTRAAPASLGTVSAPSSMLSFPAQNLISLQQQGAAAATAAESKAMAVAANATRLLAATAAIAGNQAEAVNTTTVHSPSTAALSMLAAISPQDGAEATNTLKSTTTATGSDAGADAAPATPADPTLSQQMLALLAGSLAITAPAQPAQNAPMLPAAPDATVTSAGAGSGAAAALMASNAATQLQQSPGLAQTGALSALLDPKAAATTDAPADALKLALNVALDTDSNNTFSVATDNDDTTTLFGLPGTSPIGPTQDRTLASNAVSATPLAMPARPDDGFDDGLGTRIAWMAEQKLGHAEIRLNPEHAGPIEVRIQLDGSQVSASFNSANAEVRQALEASLPRLREMLGQQGMQLGNTDIGQRQAQQQSSQGQTTPRGPADHATDNAGTSGTALPSSAPVIVRSRGLLDEYA
jgi:flagellar hook-length control protein FliK